MRQLDTSDADFDAALTRLTSREEVDGASVDETVAAIIADVALRGDAAVLEYTARFDNLQVDCVATLEVSRERMAEALSHIESPSEKPWSTLRRESAIFMSASCNRAGSTRMHWATCWARGLPLWLVSGSMCPAVRPVTLPPC